MSNDRIFMAKLRKLFYEHPEGREFVFDENGVGILYSKSLKTGEVLLRDDVLETPAVVEMLVEDEWANNAAFLTALRRAFIANPLTEIIVFDPNGRAFGFANMPVRREDHWRRTSGDGIPIAEIVMPSWFDWTMPMRRADVLNDAGKAQMIDEHAQAFQKMFRNPNLKFATIDAEGVVEGHITPPTLTPNRTWASSAKFELSTTAVSFGWQYYWMVSRSEVGNATTSSKGQVWAILNEKLVYIRCIDGSLFAFDKEMDNAYPLYGLDLPELAGLNDGDIIGRPGHAVWFALASKTLSRLAPEYGWVTGGEGYVRIHTQQPIYSPQKGWVSKGYDTFEMDVPLDGLSERLAIYGRSTKEVGYV